MAPNIKQGIQLIKWPLGLMLFCIFGAAIFSFWLEKPLYMWGILPRSPQGLIGLFTWPLLHGSWEHLFSNLFPLLVLSMMIAVFYPKVFHWVWGGSYLIPGLWLWAAGPGGTYTIGASGMVYALAFFLVFTGIFHRQARQLVVSLLVVFLYGGMIWGLLPMDPHVSWQGHLFGALTGILLAYYYRQQTDTQKGPVYSWENEPDHEASDAFAPWNYQSWSPPPTGFSYPDEDHGAQKKGTD